MSGNLNSWKASSESLKRRWKEPAFRAMMKKATSRGMKNRIKKNPTQHQRISNLGGKAVSIKFATDFEFRNRVSNAAKKNIKEAVKLLRVEGPVRTQALKNLAIGRKLAVLGKTSKCQRKLFTILKKKFTNLKLEHYVVGYWVDIALPYKLLGIEVDGSYWHQNKEREKIRESRICGIGWKLLRVSSRWSKKDVRNCMDFLKFGVVANRFPRVRKAA